jgi:pimeloyl-ACP methyl ester carboxylesterase
LEQGLARTIAARRSRTDFLPAAIEALTALLHPGRRDDPDLLRAIRRMVVAVGLDGFERQQQIAASRPDSRPHLSAIGVETLVLVGDSDPLTPPDCGLEIAAAIDGASFTLVPDCGHLSPIERPGPVALALEQWIGS